jgi:hypothetical protein
MEHAERVIIGMRRARLKGKRIKIDMATRPPEMLETGRRAPGFVKAGGPRKFVKGRN